MLIYLRIFIAGGLGDARITLWASLFHSSYLIMVRSVHQFFNIFPDILDFHLQFAFNFL